MVLTLLWIEWWWYAAVAIGRMVRCDKLKASLKLP